MPVQFKDEGPVADLGNFKNFSIIEGVQFDVDQMTNSFDQVLSSHPFEEATDQICFTHTPFEYEKELTFEGCGSLTYQWSKNPYNERGELKKREVALKDSDFSVFNPVFQDTYFYTIYSKMSEYFKIGRMRLMVLPPKKCMSWHSDTEIRCHLPIVTDPSCRMVIDTESIHIPANGVPYICDTKKFHTALNGTHKLNRVHLVLGLHPMKEE